MRLGKLIDMLKKCDQEKPLFLRVDGVIKYYPCDISSYRGDYSHLAIERNETEDSSPIKVGDFIKELELCIGKTFTGYKGGDFVMDDTTPIWVSDYGITESYKVIPPVELYNLVYIDTFEDDYI